MKILCTYLMLFLISPMLIWADQSPRVFQLSSTAFEDNMPIPSKYTCDGENVSPSLIFQNIPVQTQSLALTVSDPDAPHGRWSHWVVYNIPPATHGIAENSAPGLQGVNDFRKLAYGGPCPPVGKPHHYIFHAYALDTILSVKEGISISELESVVQGHIIAQTQLVGTYQKA